jgi:hypothetical protein
MSELFDAYKTLIMTEGSKYTNLILNELKLEAPEVISL